MTVWWAAPGQEIEALPRLYILRPSAGYAAAGLATLDLYLEEDLFARAASLSAYWEDAVHSLSGCAAHVVDVRNLGLMGAVELAPRDSAAPSARAAEVFSRCFEQGPAGALTLGDHRLFSPPLIIEKSHIDEIVGKRSGA